MSGRPKPTALKILTGNPGKRPLPENEPQPTGIPTCPSHLNATAKREWTRVSRELLACGLLTSVDRAALSCYCVAWSRLVEAEKKIAATGLIVQSPAGYPIVNPYVGIVNRQMDIIHKFIAEFGLSPASRARISVNPDAKTGNKLEKFLAKKSKTPVIDPPAPVIQ